MFCQNYHHAPDPGQSWLVSAGFGAIIRFKPVKLEGRGEGSPPQLLCTTGSGRYVTVEPLHLTAPVRLHHTSSHPKISSSSWLFPRPHMSDIEMQQEEKLFRKALLASVQSGCLQTQAGREAACRDRSFALAYGVKSD